MVTRGPVGLLMAFLAVLCACTSDLSPVQPVLDAATIRIADSEPHDVRIEAPADAAVLITVSGKDVDIRASVLNPALSTNVYADAPNRRMGIETLLFEPPHDGVIVVRIMRNDHRNARGTAGIKAVVLPVATDADRRRLEAARLEATACLRYPDPANGKDSAETFAAAAAIGDEIGDPSRFATALLHAAGVHYLRLNDWTGAAELAARAGAAFEDTGDPVLAAFALRVEGAALDMVANSGDLEAGARGRTVERARERLTRAARQFEALGMSYEAGYALNYRGVSFYESGERERARDDLRRALEHFQAAGDRPAQALSLQSLAQLEYEDGRLVEATRQFEEALRLIPRDEDPEGYAHTLHNSALPLRVLGRFEEAIARFFEAGQILHGLGDRNGEARALHGMAAVQLHAGDPDRAKELLQVSVRLRQETGVRREQAVSLILLGNIERDSGNPEAAIEFHQQAARLVQSPNDRAKALLALAQDYMAAGRLEPARASLVETMALGLPPSHRDRGAALAELGTLDARQGAWSASDAAFEGAIAVHRMNGSELEQARAFQRRAEAKFLRGDMDATLDDADAALRLFESVGIAGTQAEGRAAFRSSYRGATELRIAALLRNSASARQRGESQEAQRLLQVAFIASDRSRAHLLTDDANGGAATHDVPADWLAGRRALYDLLVGKRQQQERLLDSARQDVAQLAAIEKDIALLRTEAALIEGRIAKRHSRSAGAAGADPTEMLRTIPDGVRIAEYFIGERRGWLFEVTNNEVSAHELSDLEQLDSLARRLHQSWQSPAATRGDRYALSRSIARIAFAPLIGSPPAPQLRIVPDGALHLVPMALLANHAWPGMKSGSAIVIPSLQTTQPGQQRRHVAPDRLLAVIADPVFTPDDLRLGAAAAPRPPHAPATDRYLTRATRSLESMQRLPATAVEAREIVKLAGGSSGVLALVGLDASRSAIESASLGRFRIVHFATHAIADSRDPALAMLGLSRWNEDGKPLDGALRLHDISRWQLNADLVVLSGCDTAVGREIAGEGPLGLSQAFLQAGARSVVATLWQVPDSSTAFLMREFYRHLLTDKLDAAVALQLAQDAVRRQERWSDPYYWAGFQMVSVSPIDRNNDVERRRE
ncbi:MAG: CHAT domain-containing protein [Steroidobacteraceae bacterium]